MRTGFSDQQFGEEQEKKQTNIKRSNKEINKPIHF